VKNEPKTLHLGYYEQCGTVRRVKFDPMTHVDICDWRGNSLITPDKTYYNSVYILIKNTIDNPPNSTNHLSDDKGELKK
jgi:hypothetical protein